MSRKVIFVDPEFWTNPPPKEGKTVTDPPGQTATHEIAQMVEAGEQ